MSDEQKTTIPSEGYLVCSTPSIMSATNGLRIKDGKLQQQWRDIYSGATQWIDVPEWKEGDPE